MLMKRRQVRAVMRKIYGLLLALALTIALAGCANVGVEGPPLDHEEVVAALKGRSFRQFVPSIDASPRKAVILDFHEGIQLWAQYSKDSRAVNEWEIVADDYRVEGERGGSEVDYLLQRPGVVAAIPHQVRGLHPNLWLIHLHQKHLRRREDFLQAERS